MSIIFIKYSLLKYFFIKQVILISHSYSTTTSIQSVEENCTHDHSYVKNISVTKIPVIDHSNSSKIAMHMLNLGIKNIKISNLASW